MSTLDAVIATRLRTFAPLAALIGGRVYPVHAPQTAITPLVVYSRIARERQSGMGSDSLLSADRIQIDCYATTYGGMIAVKRQVDAALRRHMDGAATPPIRGVLAATEQNWYEPEVSQYRAILEYDVWHEEAA